MTSVLCADHPSNTQLHCLVSSDLEPPHPLTKPQTQSSSQSSNLNQKFRFTLQQCSPLLLAHPTLTQLFFHVCVYSVAQTCPTLCDPMDCSLPSSSVRGLFQARILEWVAIPSSRGSSQPRDQTQVSYVSCIGRWVLYH